MRFVTGRFNNLLAVTRNKREPKRNDSSVKANGKSNGQAIKSARGMPWHWEPKKGVAIYEKPRGAESRP